MSVQLSREDCEKWKEVGQGVYINHLKECVDTNPWEGVNATPTEKVNLDRVKLFAKKKKGRSEKIAKLDKQVTTKKILKAKTEFSLSSVKKNPYPYHPLLFHIDLANMAYYIYGQTLAFPFDPYVAKAKKKAHMVVEMNEFVAEVSPKNALLKPMKSYRGPGALGGFHTNDNHVPLIFRYANIDVSKPNLYMPSSSVLVQRPPSEISDNIKQVFIVSGKPVGVLTDNFHGKFESENTHEVVIEAFPPKLPKSKAKDILLCFEGGTGGSLHTKQTGMKYFPHSQSIMGFVLMRYTSKVQFDVHIVFRGSRSGGGKDDNPDWCTDVPGLNKGFEKAIKSLLSKDTWKSFPQIAGGDGVKVHNGFAYSMSSMLPQLMKCFEKVAELAPKGEKPNRITVTGHSLGAGLAQHFVSAIHLGTFLGSTYPALPKKCEKWNWVETKLITFSAPRAGNAKFAKALNEAFQAEGFTSETAKTKTTDKKALNPANGRLGDGGEITMANKRCAFRVLISNDLITSSLAGFLGLKNHVGTTVYCDHKSTSHSMTAAHEYSNVRYGILLWNNPKKWTLMDPSRLPAEELVMKMKCDDLVLVNLKDVTKGSPEYYKHLVDVFLVHDVKYKYLLEDYEVFKGFLQLRRLAAINKRKLIAMATALYDAGFISLSEKNGLLSE